MRTSLVDRLTTAALVLVPLCFGLFALSLGQDSNWDLRNYHWYNPYAYLNDRLAKDLGVAHHATFFNPLLDVPIYLLGRELPARAMGFLLGTVHGLNFVAVFVLANILLAEAGAAIPAAGRRGIAAVVALVGVLGGGHLALVGAVFNDNIVSLPIFAGAILLLRYRARLFAAVSGLPGTAEIAPLLAGGALIGIAAGLKLSSAVFAVGFCGAFLFVGGAIPRRLAQSFIFGLGVLAGLALAGGPWMAVLWRDYANPVFPFFNDIFQSPMSAPESYRETHFLPKSLWEALAFPFMHSIDPNHVGEIFFRDVRIAVAYATLLVTAALALLRRQTTDGARLADGARYLVAATVLTYGAWMLVFSVYRYVVPLEMLTPLLAVLAIAAWPMSQRLRRATMVAVLAIATLVTHRGEWGHIPWQDGAFVTAAAPAVSDPGNTLALVTGTYDPVGWVVASFPPEIPFIRIQGFLLNPDEGQIRVNERVSARIDAHRGTIFVLFPHWQTPDTIKALTAYGLSLDRDSCLRVTSNLGEHPQWCRVVRTESF